MNVRKRILVIKLSSLGDIFHALPAVNNLKVGLDADIDWVTQPEYVDLVRCFPVVSRVIPFPRRQFLSHAKQLYGALRECRYDYIVDFQGLLKSAFVARLAKGNVRIGPSFHREGTRLFYDVIAGPLDKNRHAVDENLDVVRYLGLPVLPVAFPVVFPEHRVDLPKPWVGIVPVSRRANKNWPVASFAETASVLQQEFGASIFLFGTRVDREACERISLTSKVAPGKTSVVNLAGETNLLEMGSWFRQMDLVVANDSGPLHMAVALGVPVVTIFGPTDPKRTGPYGAGHGVCTTEVACRPCFAKVCPLPVTGCMSGISVKQVVGEARKVLSRIP